MIAVASLSESIVERNQYNDDFNNLNKTVKIDGVDILMKEIYHKVVLAIK
jgi:hypothetical protein